MHNSVLLLSLQPLEEVQILIRAIMLGFYFDE